MNADVPKRNIVRNTAVECQIQDRSPNKTQLEIAAALFNSVTGFHILELGSGHVLLPAEIPSSDM